MHLRVQRVVFHFLGHFDFDLLPQSSYKNRVLSKSQQISCLDAIMVLLIVAYYFGVTVTLTSDFGLLKSCAEHISYTKWHRNPILGIHVGLVECCILF